MTIDIYCTGFSSGQDLTVLGGAGVVLVFTDAHKRTQKREFYFALGGSTQDLADTQAVRLGLAAVAPAFRGAKTTVHVSSPIIADGLTTLGQAGHAVQEARRWYGYYKDIQVVLHSEPTALLERAEQLARTATTTQKDFDSLTQGATSG